MDLVTAYLNRFGFRIKVGEDLSDNRKFHQIESELSPSMEAKINLIHLKRHTFIKAQVKG